MKLQIKIMILLSSVIAILITAIVSFQILGMKQKKVFLDENQKNHAQVIDQVMKIKSESMKKVSLDYSGWDDMVLFAVNPDTLWAVDNIDMAVSAFELSFLAVYNIEKEDVYITIDSSDLNNYIVFDKEFIENVFEGKVTTHFYKYFNNNLYEIAGDIIVTSADYEARITEPQGYLFVAKKVDEVFLADLQLATNFNTALIQKSDNVVLKNEDKNKIVNYRILTDNFNAEVAILEFSSENSINHETKAFVFATIVIIAITFISLIIFFIVIQKVVTTPISKITQTLDSENTEYISEYLKKSSEFGRISLMISSFFNQKKELHLKNVKLVEQSEEIRQQNEILYQQKEEIMAQTDMVKEINDQLTETNNQLRYQTEALDSSASVTMIDINGNITYTNQKFVDILEYSKTELLKNKFDSFIDERKNIDLQTVPWNIKSEKKLWRGEICVQSKTGKIIWFDSSIIPFLDDQNNVYQYLSINIEITEKKLANIELKHKSKQITDSILYAKKIQEAILKQSFIFTEFFKDSFIYFVPRDIVSGDFFFIKKVENKIIFTAADCTGHGVPGAFMSLLGTTFLNEIIRNNPKIHANQILNELRLMIKESLGQNKNENVIRNGIDMALCIYDIEKKEIEYAGAYNPLYIIRNNNNFETTELTEIKADVMPVGVYIKEEREFTLHKFKIYENDTLYLFSDGYKDQFGGEKNSKLKSLKMKELLVKNQKNSLESQKNILENFFINWKGKNPQIDDVVVFGVRF